MMVDSLLIKVGDVSHLLGVHVSTVRRWEKKGILKSYRISRSGYRWFLKQDIDNFLIVLKSK